MKASIDVLLSFCLIVLAGLGVKGTDVESPTEPSGYTIAYAIAYAHAYAKAQKALSEKRKELSEKALSGKLSEKELSEKVLAETYAQAHAQAHAYAQGIVDTARAVESGDLTSAVESGDLTSAVESGDLTVNLDAAIDFLGLDNSAFGVIREIISALSEDCAVQLAELGQRQRQRQHQHQLQLQRQRQRQRHLVQLKLQLDRQIDLVQRQSEIGQIGSQIGRSQIGSHGCQMFIEIGFSGITIFSVLVLLILWILEKKRQSGKIRIKG